MIQEFLNHLWQSTLFAAVGGLLTLALGRAVAKVRYGVWLIASLKFLIPFSLLIWLGSQWNQSLPIRTDWTFAIEAINEPFTARAVILPTGVAAHHPPNIITPVLLLVWLSGMALVAVWRWREWLRIRASLRGASPIGRADDVAVMSSSALLEPGVFGIFRPVLVLPEGIGRRLSSEELQAIVAHELCHVRRRDNLAGLLHIIVEAIFWFHPLVWWLGARIVEERERACDEEVLRMGNQPQVYAEGILKACRFYLESPLACVSGVTGSDLKQRVERIMSDRVEKGLGVGRKVLLAGAAIAAVTAPVALGLLHAQSQPAADAPVTFEAASVKPNKGGSKPRFDVAHGRVTFTAATLGDCIERAYGIKRYQVLGPEWLRTERYDVVAKAEDDASFDKLMLMLRQLLTERFKLAVHRETKDLPVYALTVGKNGPKFHAAEGEGRSSIMPKGGALTFRNYSMPDLAGFLSRIGDVGRPVIDKTALPGAFDFTLKLFDDPNMTPIDMKRAMEEGRHDSSIFTDLEQIGLKLVGEKDPVDTIVVDRAEKVPAEN